MIVDLNFGIMGRAGPYVGMSDDVVIVIAAHQMFDTVQALDRRDMRRASRDIAEVPDGVAGADHLVPAHRDVRVHLGNRSKRALMDVDGAVIAKVGVSGEEDRHDGYTLECARTATSPTMAIIICGGLMRAKWPGALPAFAA